MHDTVELQATSRHAPGSVRDAIFSALRSAPGGLSLKEIQTRVRYQLGDAIPESSIRSYLSLNVGTQFNRIRKGLYAIPGLQANTNSIKQFQSIHHNKATIFNADCIKWMQSQPDNKYHAVVTDPPYGLSEYSKDQLEKLRNGRGGIWRVPPSFDGTKRSPLPRFTILSNQDIIELELFFNSWATELLRILVPGANVIIASNPLLSNVVSNGVSKAGFERRGEIIRLVMTMRGGDRPKDAHYEFSGVSVMPRSMWEPWLLFRKPLEGRVQDNLRKWKTGGFRRISESRPFGDVIKSAPTRSSERLLAPHPSLKPQNFLRQVCRAALPLGEGTILDPFCGSGSTLAACENVGYSSVGVERDIEYFNMAKKSIPKLAELQTSEFIDPTFS